MDPHLIVLATSAAQSVDDAIGDFHDSVSWDAQSVEDTTIAGEPAKQFDLVAKGGGTPIGVKGRGTLELDAGDRGQLTAWQLGGNTLVTLAVTRPGDFTAFVPEANKVIESIQLAP